MTTASVAVYAVAMEVVTGYPIALEMPVLNCPDPPPPPPPPPPEMLISIVVPDTTKVCPAPTKLSVFKGPDVIEVPAELIPRLNPPVAVTIPAEYTLLTLLMPQEVRSKLSDPAIS
jgi:hypothetical protein